MYIDGRRSGARAESKESARATVLRAGRLSGCGARAGGADGGDRQGAGRPDPYPARRRAPQARGQGLRLRARSSLRPLAAHGLAPPQGPARSRHRRLRAAGAVGLLLRQPRITGGIERMAELTEKDEIREAVRERYAEAAAAASAGAKSSCCGPEGSCGCGPDSAVLSAEQLEAFGPGLYSGQEQGSLPDAARLASLGCGNPTAVAELHEGETVLDLGSGGGIDVLLSARRVGPTGKAYGLDMTDEMLNLAKRNQAEAGVENVEWLKGHIED